MTLEATLAVMEKDPNAFCERDLDDTYLPTNHNISAIINRHRAAGISNLDQFPNAVILDIDNELKEFENNVYITEYELDKSETMCEIMLYITHVDDALTLGIPALGNDITEIHSRECGFQDSKVIADATMKLGTALFHKFKTAGMYSPEGLLPFEFKGWIGNSPYLVKSTDVA